MKRCKVVGPFKANLGRRVEIDCGNVANLGKRLEVDCINVVGIQG